jgi:hypothetical protein
VESIKKNAIRLWEGTIIDLNSICGFGEPKITVGPLSPFVVYPNHGQYKMDFLIFLGLSQVRISEIFYPDHKKPYDPPLIGIDDVFILYNGEETTDPYNKEIKEFVEFSKKFNDLVDLWNNEKEIKNINLSKEIANKEYPNKKKYRLLEILNDLKETKHYEGDDPFYSCPMNPDYIGTEDKKICTCGMINTNKKIDKAISIVNSLSLDRIKTSEI